MISIRGAATLVTYMLILHFYISSLGIHSLDYKSLVATTRGCVDIIWPRGKAEILGGISQEFLRVLSVECSPRVLPLLPLLARRLVILCRVKVGMWTG